MFTKRRQRTVHQRGSIPEAKSYSENNRGSLKDLIKLLHGEGILAEVNSFSKNRSSLAKHLTNLAFLKRCRDNNIVPKFLRIKDLFGTEKSKRILKHTSQALLRERISHIKHQLHLISERTLRLHLSLASTLRPDIWATVDRISAEQAERIHSQSSEQQKQKFQKLVPQPNIPTPLKDTVKNLSNFTLSQEATSALSKGPNFAIAPPKIPKDEIISQIEDAILGLPTEAANNIRRQTSNILRNAKPPKPNLTRPERLALRELNSNPEIIILPADKGNATVVLNKHDYDTKIRTLLDDATYRKIPKDPTTKIERRTTLLINESKLSEPIRKSLKPKESHPPRLYGLPKIHKTNIPLRPIVSAINSPTYRLARYLASELKPLLRNSGSRILNSKDFVEKIQQIRLHPNDILVSFDVESLFTKVPIPDTLEIIKTSKKIPEHLLPLIEHCLTSTYFVYQGQFYEQITGAAMGSPISPIIADIFMEHFEDQALSAAQLKPELWLRYVDDTFVVWRHGKEHLPAFLSFLNAQHPNIRFTMETEDNNQLPFLDVLVTKKPDGLLGHGVYRKPTHTNRYLHAASHHHPSQKESVISSLTHRALVVSDPTNLDQELTHLHNTLRSNGYTSQQIKRTIRKLQNPTDRATDEPTEKTKLTAFLPYIQGVTDSIGRILRKNNIKPIFKPPQKIGQFLTSPKDERPPLSSSGVYRIPCSCGKVYIGETGRKISTRLKEHIRCVRLKHFSISALAEHQMETGHQILFDQTTALANSKQYFPRKYREALEIRKHPNNINRDTGYQTHPIWNAILPVF